uniref:Integrase catalytic domain-containing protein n=1 Tax=Panagrolaimus sp. JU765 TaxID=591449 RepID=A0AC34Q3Q5_9BILA
MDEIESIYLQMESLGLDTENKFLQNTVIEKFPFRMQAKLRVIQEEDKPTKALLEEMSKTVKLLKYEQEARMEVNHNSPRNQNKPRTQQRSQGDMPSNLTTTDHTERQNQRKCILCEALDHGATKCPVFVTAEQRRNQLQHNRRCTNCTSTKHDTQSCRNSYPCKNCGEQGHPNILCPKRFGPPSGSFMPPPRTEHPKQQKSSTVMASIVNPTRKQTRTSFIATTSGRNPDDEKQSKEVNIFFDGGSSNSFITRKLAHELRLKTLESTTMSITNIHGGKSSTTEKLVRIKLATQQDDVTLELTTIRKIGNKVLGAVNGKPKEVVADILIGQDLMPRLTEIGTMKNDIWEIQTVFGTTQAIPTVPVHGHTFVVQTQNTDLQTLEELWNLKGQGIQDQEKEDEEAQRLFLQNTKMVKDRYSVSWPLKPNIVKLKDNFGQTMGRLRSTVNNVTKTNPELLQTIKGIFDEQEEQGIIEKVHSRTSEFPIFYVPFSAVVKADHATTKVRVVLDASARPDRNGPSLNECMYRGPIQLPKIVGILLRCRFTPTVLTGDIAKAFLQLGLNENSRDLTRFIFLKDINKPITDDNIQVYRYKRMIFGFIASPSMLASALQVHFDKLPSNQGKEIMGNTYVDNIFLFCNHPEEAIQKYQLVKSHLEKAHMNVRQFWSNDEKVRNLIPEKDRSNVPVKLLGLNWTIDDFFQIEVHPDKKQSNKVATLKTVVSQLANTFDPLGLVAPLFTMAKVFVQQLHKMHFTWHQPLDEELSNQWKTIKSRINSVWKIPRHIKWNNQGKMEIHVFTDASNMAYGAVAYVRLQIEENKFESHVILSKSRICPLNKDKLGIPKLELLGAWTGTRMSMDIREEIKQPIDITRWTDSTTVLQWLDNPPKNTFVQNRIKEMYKAEITFRHVPGKQNPADILSRGSTVDQLQEYKEWFEGPQFLKTNDWKQWTKRSEPKLEIAATSLLAQTRIMYEGIDVWSQAKTWSKATRIMAYVIRFVNKIRRKQTNKQPGISLEEYKHAEHYLVRIEQKLWISEQQIKKHGLQLNNGLYVFHGRMSVCRGKQMFIPKESPAAEAIIKEYHERTLHSMADQILVYVRQKFWIPAARQVCIQVIHNCEECARWTAKPFRLPDMPQQPEERTQMKIFANVGVDYFGPFQVKINQEKIKVWILIFTCFNSRATHLEVTHGMSATLFLNAFKRFMSRFGLPTNILSDNAKQFVTAAKVIIQQVRHIKEVNDFMNNMDVSWKFTTEKAPWKGALYERLIGIAKSTMKRAIGRKLLTEDDFQTLVKQTEALMNSRPLIPVTAHTTTTLTPAMLLGLNPINILDTTANTDDEDDPTYEPNMERKKLLQLRACINNVTKKVWTLWKDQYLDMVRERAAFWHQQKHHCDRQPRIGELVIMEDEQNGNRA